MPRLGAGLHSVASSMWAFPGVPSPNPPWPKHHFSERGVQEQRGAPRSKEAFGAKVIGSPKLQEKGSGQQLDETAIGRKSRNHIELGLASTVGLKVPSRSASEPSLAQ